MTTNLRVSCGVCGWSVGAVAQILDDDPVLVTWSNAEAESAMIESLIELHSIDAGHIDPRPDGSDEATRGET